MWNVWHGVDEKNGSSRQQTKVVPAAYRHVSPYDCVETETQSWVCKRACPWFLLTSLLSSAAFTEETSCDWAVQGEHGPYSRLTQLLLLCSFSLLLQAARLPLVPCIPAQTAFQGPYASWLPQHTSHLPPVKTTLYLNDLLFTRSIQTVYNNGCGAKEAAGSSAKDVVLITLIQSFLHSVAVPTKQKAIAARISASKGPVYDG